jgi:hypothetical protein
MKSRAKKAVKVFVVEPIFIFFFLLSLYFIPIVFLPLFTLAFAWWLYLPRLQYREGYRIMIEYYVEEQSEEEIRLIKESLATALSIIKITPESIDIHKTSSLEGVTAGHREKNRYTLFITNKVLDKGSDEIKLWIAENILLVAPSWKREEYNWLKRVQSGFIVFIPALFLSQSPSILVIAFLGVVVSRIIWFMMWWLHRGDRKRIKSLLGQII